MGIMRETIIIVETPKVPTLPISIVLRCSKPNAAARYKEKKANTNFHFLSSKSKIAGTANIKAP